MCYTLSLRKRTEQEQFEIIPCAPPCPTLFTIPAAYCVVIELLVLAVVAVAGIRVDAVFTFGKNGLSIDSAGMMPFNGGVCTVLLKFVNGLFTDCFKTDSFGKTFGTSDGPLLIVLFLA